MSEKSRIVHASAYIDALKSSGYKSTYNAIAEIVDNSIDANAKNIFIIGEQTQAPSTGGRLEKRIVSFAFLDDGSGMDFDTLKGCLSIGYSTNAKTRKGMGRYGVGLPQSSVFVCERVEVYSWQNGIENCKCTYLDLEEIVKKDLNEIDDPLPSKIPDKYKCYLNWKSNDKKYNFNNHGTLVVWNNCTRVDHKKWTTCQNHMEEDLGRKYRYFLNKDVDIVMCELVSKKSKRILPNDPLYLMAPSQECLTENIIDSNYISEPYNIEKGYTESLFEPFKASPDDPDFVTFAIKYEEDNQIKTGTVEIKYSVVKEKYYSKKSLACENKPGSLPYGKTNKIKNNLGISIVRQGREIDFGSFGFFSIYNVPEYRWWGCEISFTQNLDSAFGISNNKQYVDLKPMTKEDMKDYKSDEIQPVWMQLYNEIFETVKKMDERNEKIRTESKSSEDNNDEKSEAGKYIKLAEEESNETVDLPEDNLSDDERKEYAKNELAIEGIENANDEQINQFLLSNVRFRTEARNRIENFMTYSYAANVLIVTFNSNHDFYNVFVKKIWDNRDERIAFQMLISSLFKSVLELRKIYTDEMDLLVKKINDKLFTYIAKYKKDIDE